MKDVNVEYGNECFSGLAVVKHSKEVFVNMNKSRMFKDNTDDETEVILSEIYDIADIAVKAANTPIEMPEPVAEPVIEQEDLQDNTEDKQRGIQGTSAGKKIDSKRKR